MPLIKEKTPMPAQDAQERIKNFNEVALGYSEADALQEAERCISCKKPACRRGCPVEIDIPAFIAKIRERDFLGAANSIKEYNNLPAICGRVCPQENQCEKYCVIGKNLTSYSRLERFAADYQMANDKASRRSLLPMEKSCSCRTGPAG